VAEKQKDLFSKTIYMEEEVGSLKSNLLHGRNKDSSLSVSVIIRSLTAFVKRSVVVTLVSFLYLRMYLIRYDRLEDDDRGHSLKQRHCLALLAGQGARGSPARVRRRFDLHLLCRNSKPFETF